MIDIVKLSGRTKKNLVQLALEVAKAKPKKLMFPMLWSEKLDGNYCIALKVRERLSSIEVGEVVYVFSRTGEAYTSMEHIQSELNDVMDVNTLVIFEAYIANTKQSVISGYCRDTKEQHMELTARCHDYITLDEFIHGGTVPYDERYVKLAGIFRGTRFKHCSIVSQHLVESMEHAMKLTKSIWELGGEGGILRNPHGLYAGGLGCPVVGTKRSEDIIKLKQSVTYDLEVVGVNIGDTKGKYSNTLGTLECRWKDGKTLPVSGMTNVQRDLWWSNPSQIIGKIIEVKAMTNSTHGSLREARFKSVRFDKLQGDF